MRPSSIVTFDRLYLVATGLGLVNSFMSIDRLQAQIEAMPQLRALQAGPSIAYFSVALSVLIPLLLWFLVAHRASVVAKWVLVAWTALAIANLLPKLGLDGGLGVLMNLAVEALRVVALSFLFRADAKAWFAGGNLDADAEG